MLWSAPRRPVRPHGYVVGDQGRRPSSRRMEIVGEARVIGGSHHLRGGDAEHVVLRRILHDDAMGEHDEHADATRRQVHQLVHGHRLSGAGALVLLERQIAADGGHRIAPVGGHRVIERRDGLFRQIA